MPPVRAVVAFVGAVLLVSAVGAGAGPAVAQAGPTPDGSVGNATAAPFGTHLSAFMQSNAARATDAVESGMWRAAYDEAATRGARAALVRRQADHLESRVERLRERKAALQAARQNGTMSPIAYRARLGRIAGTLGALTEAIDETEHRAATAGVEGTRLDALRGRVDAVASGPVDRVARGLDAGANRSIGPPGASEADDRGPPGNAGPPDDGGTEGDPGRSTNATARGGPAADRSNAPDGERDPATRAGNESDGGRAGSSDTGGGGDSDEGDGATPNDAGNDGAKGNDGERGSDSGSANGDGRGDAGGSGDGNGDGKPGGSNGGGRGNG